MTSKAKARNERYWPSLQNDVHMETGPCAGSCAYGNFKLHPNSDQQIWWKLEVCALLEKPSAQDVVLSLN